MQSANIFFWVKYTNFLLYSKNTASIPKARRSSTAPESSDHNARRSLNWKKSGSRDNEPKDDSRSSMKRKKSSREADDNESNYSGQKKSRSLTDSDNEVPNNVNKRNKQSGNRRSDCQLPDDVESVEPRWYNDLDDMEDAFKEALRVYKLFIVIVIYFHYINLLIAINCYV